MWRCVAHPPGPVVSRTWISGVKFKIEVRFTKKNPDSIAVGTPNLESRSMHVLWHLYGIWHHHFISEGHSTTDPKRSTSIEAERSNCRMRSARACKHAVCSASLYLPCGRRPRLCDHQPRFGCTPSAFTRPHFLNIGTQWTHGRIAMSGHR